MNIVPFQPGAEADVAAMAADVLRRGGVVLFPTDTLYALGADALSDAAVDTVFAIKGRDRLKPIHALVEDESVAGQYGVFNETASALLARSPKGKISLVVEKKPGFETGIMRGMHSFGFRIPDHLFCQQMLRAFGGPVTATSANLSGETDAEQGLGAILAQLGSAVSLIDLAIDGGTLPPSLPSTVVDVRTAEARVLREGAVHMQES